MCDEGLCKYGKNVHCNIGSGMGSNKTSENPFDSLKEEQDDGMTNEMVVEKHVSALNDSFIKKFKQNDFVNHGRGYIRTNNFSTCQI
jgi:hypothetical protein